MNATRSRPRLLAALITLLMLGMIHAPRRADAGPPPLTPQKARELRALLGLAPDQEVTFEYAKRTDRAEGRGAGFTTSSDEAAGKINTTAPTAALPGAAEASGGGTRFAFDVSTARAEPVKWALWIGGLALAAFGAWKLRRGHAKQGPTLIAAGACVFIAGFFPLAAAGLVLVAAAGYLAWQKDAATRDELRAGYAHAMSVLGKVARGVKLSGDDHAAAVKRSIDTLTTAEDDALIAEAKRRADV